MNELHYVLFLVDGKVGMYFGDTNILGDFEKLEDFERENVM